MSIKKVLSVVAVVAAVLALIKGGSQFFFFKKGEDWNMLSLFFTGIIILSLRVVSAADKLYGKKALGGDIFFPALLLAVASTTAAVLCLFL